jgi:hypothetical protein
LLCARAVDACLSTRNREIWPVALVESVIGACLSTRTRIMPELSGFTA